MKGKLALDMLSWDEKRKAMISEEISLNTSRCERQISIENDKFENQTILITFS